MNTMTMQTSGEKRRHQRLKVVVPGRFMLPDRSEHRCLTVDMSPGGVLLQSLVVPYPRTKIVVYLDELGRLEGQVSRVQRDGFALRLIATANKMEKTAASLTWLASRDDPTSLDSRRSRRCELEQPAVALHTDHGTSSGRILNLAEHGAAIAVRCQVAVGDRVSVGRAAARVVRVFEHGCAVEFLKPLDPAEITGEHISI